MTIDRLNPDLIANNYKVDFKKWWVEIKTAVPHCTYYFGPFYSIDEAVEHQDGYLEDLIAEGAREITINIKKCRPQILTLETY